MQIKINTGHNVNGHEEMVRHTESVVESTMGHLANHITHVEVHISDENSKKGGGNDKRCMMEARLKGHQPIAVTKEAITFDQAICGAADKLKSSLDHTFGRLKDHEGRKHLNIKRLNSLSDIFVN